MKRQLKISPEIVKTIKKDCLNSTNDYLKHKIDKFISELPVAVIASEQTSGRGREIRRWFSPFGGGLYCSFLFNINSGSIVQYISVAAAVAVINSIKEYCGIECTIKWPNDIEICGKKVGGILTENQFSGKKIVSVIGVGINLNIKNNQFPQDLRGSAVSLGTVTGVHHDPNELFSFLNRQMFKYLNDLSKGRNSGLVSEFRNFIKYRPGDPVNYHLNGDSVDGKYRGINENGAIIIEKANGEIFESYSGELL